VFRGGGREARRAKAVVRLLGRGQLAPTHELGACESTVNSPSELQGETPVNIDLGTFSTLKAIKNDSFEPLVMLVKCLTEILEVFKQQSIFFSTVILRTERRRQYSRWAS